MIFFHILQCCQAELRRRETGENQACAELDALQKEVWTRVKRHDFLGKSAVVKIKFSDFQQITRSKTMPTAFQSLDEIQTVRNESLDSVELDGRKVRLLGLTVGNSSRHCSECVQLCLDFD